MLRRIFYILSTWSMTAYAGELRHFYIIKPSECITNTLFKAGLEPMYGEKGFLVDIQRENPDLIDLNFVLPGQKIYFPNKLAMRAKDLGLVEITENKEVVFLSFLSQAKVGKVTGPTPIVQAREPAQAATPAPLAESIAQPESIPVAKPDIQSHLEFAAGSGFSRLDSQFTGTASSAKILSNPSMNLDLKWEPIWSENLESFIQWSYETIPYKDANHGTLYNEKPSKSLLGVGLKNRLAEGLWLISEVGSREEIFAPSYAAGTSTLETASLPYAKLGLQKDLIRVRALKMRAGLSATYLLGESGGSYDIKSGFSYGGVLRLSQTLKAFTLFAEGEYTQTSQSTSQSQQVTRDVKSRLGVSIPLESAGEP